MKSKLIVFEGIEGCGKTTQIQLCYQWLQSLNIPVILTHEPGGTELGKDIRELLLNKSPDKITELLLYAADRAQHTQEVLKPALATGKHILCDRFTNSTIAYQGYGRKIDMDLIHKLNQIATGGLKPDITIWIDVDVETGLLRKVNQKRLDRIEEETIDFHNQVRLGYSAMYLNQASLIVQVDGNQQQLVVQKNIQNILRKYFI
ncbi:MAG: hypothetical protein RLZZ184_3239 [Cyanobacteriota bacterium]|jgi:dTMP kinase